MLGARSVAFALAAGLASLAFVDNTMFIGRYFINWLLPRGGDQMDWDNYHRLDTIHNWMDSMAARYPSRVKIHTIGQSVEGRPLKVARIGTRNRKRRQGGGQPAIFIEGGIHAREWISPATVTFIMRELLTHPRMSRLTNQYDFFILPVTNPDGYEYSHTTDRLWRKNRARSPITLGLCRGVDLNRNFGFKWAEGLNILDPRPASPLPCLDTYHGPNAFSEPETKAVRDFVMSKRHRLTSYIAFHSFGNKILYPWGHTSQKAPDWRDLKAFADSANTAIGQHQSSNRRIGISSLLGFDPLVSEYKVAQQSHRTSKDEKEEDENGSYISRIFSLPSLPVQFSQAEEQYDVGQAPETIYRVAGASDDWARGEAGIKWISLFELPGGVYGFLLPPRYIRDVGHSIMAGVEGMVNHISSRR